MSNFVEERNNTDFPLSNYEFLKSLKYKENDLESYNQFLIREFLKNNKQRGLLLYGDMGSGKTRASALAMSEFVEDYKMLVIAPSKVSSKFDYEFTKVGIPVNEVKKISLKANNLIDQVERLPTQVENLLAKPLDNTFLIVDEAHNLFNSIANGSTNAVALYDTIMAAKNIKVLFLTGTPAMNRPFELATCYNMVAGYKLFPENEEDFNDVFISLEGTKMINNEVFKRRIVGLTSYVGAWLAQESEITKRRPRELPTQYVKVEMSEKQYALYSTFRDKEKEEAKGFKSNKGERFAAKTNSSSYRIKSRMSSNLVPIDGKATITDIIDSNKFQEIAKILKRHKGEPMIICSNFVHSCGLEDIAKLLEDNGWIQWDPDQITHKREKVFKPVYAIISGDTTTDESQEIQDIASKKDNINGKIMSAVLLGPAASEGIEFKNFRICIIVDPFFNDIRSDQFKNRINRIDSHIALPTNQRTVKTYKLVSVIPNDVREKKEAEIEELFEARKIDKKEKALMLADLQSTDEYLYMQAHKRKVLILQFYRAMVEAAIECPIMRSKLPSARAKRINCLMCAPTGDKMFNPRLDQDVALSNPCHQAVEQKLKAKELIVEMPDGTEKKYMYSFKDKEYTFYEYNDLLNGYTIVLRNDPYFNTLMDAV